MTDTLKLNLKNCYGIGKFEAEVEFKHKGYAIYAPNGVMKVSANLTGYIKPMKADSNCPLVHNREEHDVRRNLFKRLASTH